MTADRRAAIVRLRNAVSGPRSAHLPEFLREVALAVGVEITLDTEKRLFRESVFYTVTGSRERVNWFARNVEASIEAHNGR